MEESTCHTQFLGPRKNPGYHSDFDKKFTCLGILDFSDSDCVLTLSGRGDRYTRCVKYCFLCSERSGMLAPSSGHGKQGRGEVFIISDLQKYDIIDSEVHRRSDSSETNCAWMPDAPENQLLSICACQNIFRVFPDQQTHLEPWRIP